MKFIDVGVSYRTPGKHAALNSFLGKCAGVATTAAFRKRSKGGVFHVIDCTAGDGQSSDFSNSTSPGIICKHTDFIKKKSVPVKAEFYERSQQSASMLKQAVLVWPVIHGDALEMAQTWSANDILFVVNDPNTINDWKLPAALKNAPKMTTVFSTLGCNVGGLKRLKLEDRLPWYDHLQDQLSLLQNWHDAIIVTLDGDKSQWAYLVNAPKTGDWCAELEKAFIKAFKGTGHTLRMAWFKADNAAFTEIIDDLFQTKKERSATKKAGE